MKLIVRTFLLGLFAVGASAAVVSFHSTQALAAMTASHQAVAAAMPIPTCSPSTCGGQQPGH
jgi:hypothetical protein